jgi:hypothetical protein
VLFLDSMVGFWFFTTLYLHSVLVYSPLKAGLAFLPTTLPNFAAAMMVPRLARKLGNGGLLVAGLALDVVGTDAAVTEARQPTASLDPAVDRPLTRIISKDPRVDS